MQRWALIPSAYQYNIESVSGKLNQVLIMSQLPSESQCDSAEEIHSIMDIDNLHITAVSVKDQTLATVITAVQHDCWPSMLTTDLLCILSLTAE